MSLTLTSAEHKTPQVSVDGEGLQEPPPFWSRSVFGPTAAFTALAIGSGELVFWPGLALPYGAGILWLALGVIALQWVVNIEIGRYSLATGESIVTGASRMWRGWGVILFLGAVVPWLWPGWARAGAQLLSGATGVPEKPLSIATLLLCGVLLAVPNRVYVLVERIQAFLLGFILLGVVVLLALALSSNSGVGSFWTAFFGGEGIPELLQNASQRRSADFLALLGALVFAGAGGILNLGYGLLICEKGFGMARYARGIRGLRHSRGLSADSPRVQLPHDAETSGRWRRWMSLMRREHALVFIGGNAFTMVFVALIFFALFGGPTQTQGTAFLVDAVRVFNAKFGPLAGALFVAVGVTIFFTSALGIIDVTSRIAAAIVHSVFPGRLSASTLYHLVVWGEIVVGILLIFSDPRQPFWFLVTSAVLNTVVMTVYITLVLLLNRRQIPAMARPSRWSEMLLVAMAALYAGLFVVTLARL